MDKNLEDLAVVREIGAGYVLVEMLRSGSCNSCGLSGFCHGQDRTVTHRIKTDRELAVGDTVRVNISPALRIKSSFLIFIFPLFALIFFFIFARYAIHLSEPVSILISFLGFLLSGVIIYFKDKKMADKVSFEIVERIENEDPSE